jgi:hypothetical protein
MEDDIVVLESHETTGACGHPSTTVAVLVPDDGAYVLTVCRECDALD